MISIGFHSAILSCEDMQLLFTSSCFTFLSRQKEHSIFVKPCWEQFKLGFQKIICLGFQCCLVQIMSCICSYFSLFHVLWAFSLCWNAKLIVFCTLFSKRPLWICKKPFSALYICVLACLNHLGMVFDPAKCKYRAIDTCGHLRASFAKNGHLLPELIFTTFATRQPPEKVVNHHKPSTHFFHRSIPLFSCYFEIGGGFGCAHGPIFIGCLRGHLLASI